MKLRFLILGLFCASCAQFSDKTGGDTKAASLDVQEFSEMRLPKLVEDHPLVRLFALPEIRSSLRKVHARQSSIDALGASQEFTVSGSSDVGATTSDGALGTVSVVGQKSLNLYAENQMAIEISQSQRDLAMLDTNDLVDGIVSELLRYELSLLNLNQVIDIVGKYSSLYYENEPALEAAISAGIVNSSEKFKFKKTLSNFDRQVHEARALNAASKISVQRFLNRVDDNLFSIRDLSTSEVLANAFATREFRGAQRLKLQSTILTNDMALLETDKKAKGVAITRLSSPADTGDDWTAFAGVQFSMPIYDAGQNDALIQEKQLMLDGAKIDLEAFNQVNTSSREQLSRVVSDGQKSMAMLEDEINLTNEIINDLKTKLAFGGASISDLVSETLLLANLELQLIGISQNLKNKVIDYAGSYGVACSIAAKCKIISEGISAFGPGAE
jgi:hypothetical protein